MMYLIRGLIMFFLATTFTGCAAPIAAYGLSAVAIGYSGYGFYQITKDATAEFDMKEAKPTSNNIKKIKNMKSIAIYPIGNDGQVVDVATSVLDMKVISPAKTVSWVAKTKDLPLKSLPQSEKIQSLAKMAREVGADAVLYIKLGDAKAKVGLAADVAVHVATNYFLVDNRANLLWNEEGTMKVSGTGIGEEQLVAVLIDAVSNRIMDIRLDREIKQKKSKNWTAIFECGGKLNFTCKDDRPAEDQINSANSNQTQAKETQSNEKLVITRTLVKKTQARLNELGFDAGGADGVIGSKTIQAIKEFQSLNSLPVSGKINRETLNALSIDTNI